MSKKVHFIGIAGVGMSATALLLREQGWEVTGSDEGFYPPISTYLEEKQIPIKTPYSPENIPTGVDLIVIGKNAKLTKENPEVAEAHASGILIKNFAEVLGEATKDRNNIVFVGSFGKSSLSTLAAHCLMHAGKDPGYHVGAVSPSLPTTARLGSSKEFLMEGDEYPSGHEDPRSKFMHFHAHDILLSSADHDHVNIFKTHEEYLSTFKDLLKTLPEDGLVVGCFDNEFVPPLLSETDARIVTYSLENPEAHYYGKNISYGEVSSFDLMKEGETVVTLTTTLLGAHNIQNIIGVAALLLERELVTPEDLASGIKSFKGIIRRLDRKTQSSQIPLYEGFGSSQPKAKTALEALKLHFPKKRLIVLFEPHTFSWRNKNMIHWYDDLFTEVEEVLVYEPAQQGAGTHEQLTQDEIVERIAQSGTSVYAIHSFDDTTNLLSQLLQENDMVLMLSSAHMDGIIETLPHWMDETYA